MWQVSRGPDSRTRVLERFLLAAYLVTLLLCLPYLRRAWRSDFWPDVYALSIFLAQAAFYLAPSLALVLLADRCLPSRRSAGVPSRRGDAIVAGIALLTTTLSGVAIALDHVLLAAAAQRQGCRAVLEIKE